MAGKLFRDKTLEEQTTSLASFMPGGRPFLAARLEQTTLRKMLAGLAGELVRADSTINEITYEHEITQTTALIEEWERALGIPDCCIGNTGSLTQRRENVRIKLAECGLQTAQDFIDLAALFGYVAYIVPGADRGLFPFTLYFPIYFFDRPQTARFTQIVVIETTDAPNVFPLDFPIIFGTGITSIVECLFNRLSPANVDVVYEYILPDEDAFITESALFYLGTEDGDLLILE